MPLPVAAGFETYPQDVVEQLRKLAGELVLIPATRLAAELGNDKASNVVLIGLLASRMEIDKKTLAGGHRPEGAPALPRPQPEGLRERLRVQALSTARGDARAKERAMIRNLAELVQAAKKKKGVTAGVPCPEDDSSILSVIEAKRAGLADFILCGDRAKIARAAAPARRRRRPTSTSTTRPAPRRRWRAMVELGRQGKLQLILKGFLPTAALMKPILDKDKGLRGANLLSDILVVENPAADASCWA